MYFSISGFFRGIAYNSEKAFDLGITHSISFLQGFIISPHSCKVHAGFFFDHPLKRLPMCFICILECPYTAFNTTHGIVISHADITAC